MELDGDTPTGPEIDPYVRQRTLAGFGDEGQRALAGAAVAIVGVGGLGCPAALYLAAAGVGRITLIDSDTVSVTNLHRQVLFGPDDVGERKVDAAARRLSAIAPGCDVTVMPLRLTAANAEDTLAGHDVVVDATDTFNARLLIDDAAASLGVPVAWGAVQGWHGQVTAFGASVRLRDAFPVEPELDLDVCDSGPVMGTVCGQVATAMATEAIKIASGAGTTLEGRIEVLDGRTGRWRSLAVRSSGASASESAGATPSSGGARA
ncbi:HesA/MoeB/ThiF family protein [Demequina oxidasica]|uniref:HesA/MoeB/ThiF family protein n=1 Tax=Demequina oxidasica TaxID=676199 RepID=UPI000781B50C|nr:HesA/MoeB/ThiF family protein [Demequina oxidasica]